MKYPYLLFDNDGTLMDFEKAQAAALAYIYPQFGFPLPYSPEVLACYHKWNQHWWSRLEQGLCTKAELQPGRFRDFLAEMGFAGDAETMNTAYVAALSEGRHLIPGAEALLRELHRQHKIYIITNGVSATQYSRIGKSTLMPYIDEIFVSEDAGFAKPAPAYFDFVLKKAGIGHKSQCLVIGDSLSSDIKGANNAGIDCVWYNPQGLTNPGLNILAEVRSLEEIQALLD